MMTYRQAPTQEVSSTRSSGLNEPQISITFSPLFNLLSTKLHPLPVPLLKNIARRVEIKPLPKTRPALVDAVVNWVHDWVREEKDEVGLWSGIRMLGEVVDGDEESSSEYKWGTASSGGTLTLLGDALKKSSIDFSKRINPSETFKLTKQYLKIKDNQGGFLGPRSGHTCL